MNTLWLAEWITRRHPGDAAYTDRIAPHESRPPRNDPRRIARRAAARGNVARTYVWWTDERTPLPPGALPSWRRGVWS